MILNLLARPVVEPGLILSISLCQTSIALLSRGGRLEDVPVRTTDIDTDNLPSLAEVAGYSQSPGGPDLVVNTEVRDVSVWSISPGDQLAG